MLIGCASPSTDDARARIAQTGQWGARRTFDSGMCPSTFAASAAGSDPSLGIRESYYSCKAADGTSAGIGAVLAGKHTGSILGLWRSVPATSRLHFAVEHEGDAKVVSGRYSADEWNALQTFLAELLRSEQAAGRCLNVVHTAIVTWYYFRRTTPPAGLLDDGLRAARAVLWDSYGEGRYAPDADLQTLGYAWCAANGVSDYGIGEVSTQSSQPGGKGAWLDRFIGYAYERGATVVLGFDLPTNGSEPVLDGEGLDAFRRAVSTYQGLPSAVIGSPILRPGAAWTLRRHRAQYLP